jgi:hypothetical protein
MEPKEKIELLYLTNHYGKERAITREKFFERYGALLDGMEDRTFRRLYSHLRILTCAAGGYWPKRGSEVAEFGRNIDKIRNSLRLRRNRVLRAHHALLGKPEQQRLKFQ